MTEPCLLARRRPATLGFRSGRGDRRRPRSPAPRVPAGPAPRAATARSGRPVTVVSHLNHLAAGDPPKHAAGPLTEFADADSVTHRMHTVGLLVGRTARRLGLAHREHVQGRHSLDTAGADYQDGRQPPVGTPRGPGVDSAGSPKGTCPGAIRRAPPPVRLRNLKAALPPQPPTASTGGGDRPGRLCRRPETGPTDQCLVMPKGPWRPPCVARGR